ncbi:hypothetical protein LguiB_021689 [Lonicera macranthoides]
MAVVRSDEASSSTCYDVFLSFRGVDTRKTFTDHLYTALDQQRFRTFRDDDEMEKGEYLKSELEREIPESKSSIIVISENYASSMWCLDELVMILERRRNSNHMGTNAIEGLTFDMSMYEEGCTNSKKRRYEKFHDKSILLKHASSLKRRLLGFISGQSIKTRLDENPGMAFIYLSSFINLRLRLMDIEFIILSFFPLQFLESLKILDLSFSEWLARTPNFIGLPNLERLILEGCVSLVEVCESIEYAEMLDLLNLQDCKTLRKLPRNIGKLVSLRILVISGCNIGEFPSEMKNMKSLEVIKADGININPLQTNNAEVKLLQQIFRSTVPTPSKCPETLWACLPYSLKSLSMRSSNLSDDSFPENFGKLPSLSDLDLSKNQFRRLPNCIKSLSGIKSLNMYQCHRLQSLDLNGLMMNSGCIDVTSCRSLEKVIMSLNERVDLWLNGCYKIVGQEDAWKHYFKKDDTWKYYLQNRGIISVGHTVRPLPTHHRTQCLNVWCSMSEKTEIWRRRTSEVQTNITSPNCFPDNENVGWLSRWRFGNQLEAGHESIYTFDIKDEYEIKDGFKIVYRDAEEANGSATNMKESHHNSPTKYFVKRYFEKNPDEDLWFPKR